MSQSNPRRQIEEALKKADRRITTQPGSIDARFERACLLEALGRNKEAQQAYFDLISRDPKHFGGLNNLGNVLTRLGQRRAAIAAYEEAVKQHPDNPLGRVSLGNALVNLDDLPNAQIHFEAAIRVDPRHAAAHQGLSYVFTRLGNEEAADEHRRLGFKARPVETIPYRGTGKPVAVLLLVSATGGNTDTDSLLDDRTFLTTKVYVEFFDDGMPLPRHDVVFNAVSDADRVGPALEDVHRIVARTKAPVLNGPAKIPTTARVENAARLRTIPGVRAPLTKLLPRERLTGPQAREVLREEGFAFPLLLRSPGHHTGRHFELVETPERLAACVETLPGEQLLAIEYLDARGDDGAARKYRVIFVGSDVYPLHLAISDLWKIHYYTADMADNPEHRIEEAHFLEDMQGAIGPEATRAILSIHQTLNLDYGGIDFAVGRSGELLLFETNATMTVPSPPNDPKWAYRREPVQRILDAVRAMIVEKAGTGKR